MFKINFDAEMVNVFQSFGGNLEAFLLTTTSIEIIFFFFSIDAMEKMIVWMEVMKE